MCALRSLVLLSILFVCAGCSSYGGFYPGHPKFQAELDGDQIEAFFRRAQNDRKAVLVQRLPNYLSQMLEWRKLDGTPAGQVVLGGTRHFSMMDGEWHPSMSDKFAMVAVEPGDYFAGGHHHRFPTVELREKPQNLLPKPAPSPLGYVRFASEMWSEPYVYTETVDYYKPVITGFVGTVAISEDMYMGTRNYAATGYRKAIPTVTENLETTLLNGGLIQTLKVSAKAGEILVLPEMFLDTTTGYRYHANSCSDEGRREWICPVGAIPYLFKRADVKGFLDTLKYNGILNPWSTVVKEAPLTHNDQLKSTGFFRDGYAIYVLGEIPPELQPAKPVQRDGVAPAPKPKAAPKAKK